MQTFYTNNFGLVQGEVISPIWFAAYVNDDKMEFIDNNYEPIELKKTVRLLVIFFSSFFCVFVIVVKMTLHVYINSVLYCNSYFV
jgi:hypothetical protein